MERGRYQVSRDKVEYEGHVRRIFGEQLEMDLETNCAFLGKLVPTRW